MERVKYGRDELEWDELTQAAITHIVGAVKSSDRLTYYSHLNDSIARHTGLEAFDLTSETGRAALGELLGRTVTATYDEVGAMISAAVIYLRGSDPGPGFYQLASHLRLLKQGQDREAFWLNQLNLVQAHYRTGPPGG